MDIRFEFQKYFGNKTIKVGERIDFFEDTYNNTSQCSTMIDEYKDPRIDVESVEFENNEKIQMVLV